MNRPNLGAVEREAASALMIRLGGIPKQLHDIGDDDAAAQAVEHDVLRQLSADINAYTLRHHLTIVPVISDPVWAMPFRPIDPNAVFFSGRAEIRALVEKACAQRGLAVCDTAGTSVGAIGQARWDALRTSHVAVFDLGERAGPPRAAVYYELGVSRALGRANVLLLPEGETVPFDIDVEPCVLSGGDEGASLGARLDKAMYSVQRRQADSSVSESERYARDRFGAEDAPVEIRHILSLLDQAEGDPIQVHRILELLFGFVGPEAPHLVYPAWPGDYPAVGARRCFHVMPFSEKWSDRVSDIVRETCSGRAVYVRGDAIRDPRIIRSIWDEICGASHVLVDLTGFNPNVSLELGIAHALGRNVLMVGHGDTVRQLFPTIKHLRFSPYKLEKGAKSLRKAVADFVAAGPAKSYAQSTSAKPAATPSRAGES
jgi:hypothetical protein